MKKLVSKSSRSKCIPKSDISAGSFPGSLSHAGPVLSLHANRNELLHKSPLPSRYKRAHFCRLMGLVSTSSSSLSDAGFSALIKRICFLLPSQLKIPIYNFFLTPFLVSNQCKLQFHHLLLHASHHGKIIRCPKRD